MEYLLEVERERECYNISVGGTMLGFRIAPVNPSLLIPGRILCSPVCELKISFH